MKRELLTQMKNEWRSNIWMCVELAIVSLAMWTMFCILWMIYDARFAPKGYDMENVYLARINITPDESPLFTPYDGDHDENVYSDYVSLLNNIRNNPYVEVAGFSINAFPYNYNYYGSFGKVYNGNDTVYYNGNVRRMSPQSVEIMRLQGLNGETPEQLKKILEDGKVIITSYNVDSLDFKTLKNWSLLRNDEIKTVGAVVKPIQRNDYENPWGGSYIIALNDNEMIHTREIGIRIKPGTDKKFLESLNNPAMVQVRNVYMTDLQSIENIKDSVHLRINTMIRNLVICILFLLFSIFLGLLGTFWFRIQQRTGEIAIRKANGATKADIFRRLLSEGMILLIAATVITTVIEITCVHFDINVLSFIFEEWTVETAPRAAVTTFVILALITIAGILIPANKATKVEAAVALKEE